MAGAETAGAGASAPPRSLVVLAAPHEPGGPLGGVREVLHDWAAAGLIGDHLWLEPDPDQVGAGARLAGTLITAGGDAGTVALQDLLAGRRHDRIRLCLLVPALTADDAAPGASPAHQVLPAETEDGLAELVAVSGGRAEITRLRCVIIRPGGGTDATIARDGWHNIVVSPEDSRGPGLGHRLLAATDDPLQIGPPAASAVAGLTGLWTGLPTAPLDDQPIPPGPTVRVARGYFRRLDATDVEREVRAGVLSTNHGLPRPRSGSGQAAGIDDVGSATRTMADQLWHKHGDVLRGPRVTPPATQADAVGAIEALRMLFGFIWASIRNAPMRWYRTVVHRIATRTAAGVHGAVFGSEPSAYEVVVGGVRPDGSPAGWRDLATASGRLEQALTGSSRLQPARADLSGLWQDYAGAAFTLADAGDRGVRGGLPPIQVGTDLGVITDAADIAPGPDTGFELPPQVAADHGSSRLEAADLLGGHHVRRQLEAADDLGADRTLADLNGWQSRFADSFAVRVGARLGKAVLDTQDEIRALAEALGDAEATEDPAEETRRRQRRLARWMRGLLIGFAVLLVILGVLRWLDWIDWSVVAFVGVAALIIWLIGSFVIFVKNQQALFAELNRRRELSSQAEANRQNFCYAGRDLRRLTVAYDAFLAWSRIIGVVLQQPFGPVPVTGSGQPHLTEGLPLSVRLGTADRQPAVIAEVIEVARRGQFRTGWLTAGEHAPWTALLNDAARRLGPRAMDLRDDPQRMFAEDAGPESLLRAWATELSDAGPGTASADWIWPRIVGRLGELDYGRQLISRVAVAGDGLQDWDEFAANIDRGTDELGPQLFDPEVFGSQARIAGHNQAVLHVRDTAHQALSRVAVLVQLTEGLPWYELALAGDAADQQQRWEPPAADSIF